MAGGFGTRLWPMSRAARPKQFLSINNELTMLQATLKRMLSLNISSNITICNEEHRFFVAEQLREIDSLNSIILEPVGRNTAPAIALSALGSNDNEILLILAADHLIQNEKAFAEAVTKSIPLAEQGKLVTFGIVPDGPNTDFGYIKTGSQHGAGFVVDKFVEKPIFEVAQDYVNSGKYYWNSGMFLFKASSYLDELKKFRPDIYDACKLSMENSKIDFDFLRIDKEKFESCPSESIDYAVMEKTTNAVLVPMDAGWNDIGSWSSLWDVSEKDVKQNSIHGDVIHYNCNNSFIKSEDKLVAAIGLDDLVIVSTKDVVMVSRKDTVQDIKIIVQQLKDESRSEWDQHQEVYRPWGKYNLIDNGERYQVKRITVNPGEKLSVQKHRFRSEHWIVVSGTAKVTNQDKVFLLAENESTYIPVGALHALENPGTSLLEIIEIQSGSYLGEDDIVRFEDRYGRVTKK